MVMQVGFFPLPTQLPASDAPSSGILQQLAERMQLGTAPAGSSAPPMPSYMGPLTQQAYNMAGPAPQIVPRQIPSKPLPFVSTDDIINSATGGGGGALSGLLGGAQQANSLTNASDKLGSLLGGGSLANVGSGAYANGALADAGFGAGYTTPVITTGTEAAGAAGSGALGAAGSGAAGTAAATGAGAAATGAGLSSIAAPTAGSTFASFSPGAASAIDAAAGGGAVGGGAAAGGGAATGSAGSGLGAAAGAAAAWASVVAGIALPIYSAFTAKGTITQQVDNFKRLANSTQQGPGWDGLRQWARSQLEYHQQHNEWMPPPEGSQIYGGAQLKQQPQR